MSGKTPSLEPAKRSTEQLKDQLSEQQRVIFDFLRANPGHGFTYREMGGLLDMKKHTVRKWIVERGMIDCEFRMNGTVFKGIVTYDQDPENNAKYWYLRPEVVDRLDEPQVQIEEREVEVPRHDSLADFVRAHASRIVAFETIYVLSVVLVLWAAEAILGWGVPPPTTVGILILSSLGMLGTMLLIGYRDTQTPYSR